MKKPGQIEAELHEAGLSNSPLRRVSATNNVADAALFLMSAHASWITSPSLISDGGQCLLWPCARNEQLATIHNFQRQEHEMYNEYRTLKLKVSGPVAEIRFIPYEKSLIAPRIDLHWDLGEVIDAIRNDHSVRVIVITGDEERFLVTPTKEWQSSPMGLEYVADAKGAWLTFTGIVRTHMAMAEIEKPIIAKVNGDAIGFGASLVFGSDMVVANEDVRICHMHMSMGELGDVGPEYGLVPGDGGAALVPLFMSPQLAKEHLMLGPVHRAGDLADQKLINYALPADQIDAKVDELVEKLLTRSAYALAWTKRVSNRSVVDHLNKTLDSAAAYEMVCALQIERNKMQENFELQ